MADHPNQNNPVRNRATDPSYDVYDEDPLVELARIVSEEGGYLNISEDRQEAEPADVAPDLNYEPDNVTSFDHVEPQPEHEAGLNLENQLMEELEISMAPVDTESHQFDDSPVAEESGSVDDFNYPAEDRAALFQMSAGSIEPEADEHGYGIHEGEVPADELSEILIEQELSDLEHQLAELEEIDDSRIGATFDEDMGFATAGALDDDYVDDIDEYDDDAYTVPPAVPVGGNFDDAEQNGGRRSGRKLFAVAAVLSIAVLGGGVLAMMSSTSNNQSSSSAPPVFKASGDPLKVAPDAGTDVASDEKKTMFDAAVTDGAPVREELVERAEKPIDRVIPLHESQQTEVLRSVGDADQKDTARLSAESRAIAEASNTEPIGPRQVTTVKVSADGTIIRPSLDEMSPAVSTDNEPAIVGGLPAPVQETSTGAVASNETQPVPVRVVDIKPTGTNGAATGNTGTSSPLSEMVSGLPAPSADGTNGTGIKPLPRARPDEVPETTVARVVPNNNAELVAQPAPARTARTTGPVNLLDSNGNPRAVAAAPAAPAAPVNTGSTAGSGYVVQLSSQRSENQALAAFDGLKRRYPSLLGNYQADIQRADLGSRGIYYRVRVGPMTDQGAANQLCEQLKSSGGSCFVTR